jgi:hypothetical protein
MAIDNELEKRRLGLEFANRLDELAADAAPDAKTEHDVHELARLIRKRFTYSKELRKREILTHLKRHDDHGGMSIAELIEKSGYQKDMVYELVRDLEADGKVELRKFDPPGSKGGRPAVRYFATTIGFSVVKS